MLTTARATAFWLAGALLLAACGNDLGEPDAQDLPVAVAWHIAASAGGPAEAFERADQIAIRVSVGSEVALEESQPFSPDEATRVRVRLDRSLVGATIRIEISLLAEGDPLFRGAGSGTLTDSSPTTVELTLTPVVSSVVMTEPAALFTAIGDQLRLTAAAVFTTGDTIPDAVITWRSLDPEILTVESDGDALALAEGNAGVEATAAGVIANGTVRVQAEVVSVAVDPASDTIAVDETATFTAVARDRRQNALTRTPTWSSSAGTVASIDASGVVTGLADGVTTISASVEGISGTAMLVVLDVPRSPDNLAGLILDEAARTFELSWDDRSGNETYFSIERQIGGGDWSEIGQAPGNTSTFEGTGVPGENSFRVLACNLRGCSSPSNEVTLAFLSGPPVVTTLVSSDVGVMRGSVSAAGDYQVRFQWTDDPDNFDLTPSECEGPCYEQTTLIAGTGNREFERPVVGWSLFSTVYYRIIASNEFGESVGAVLELSFPSVSLGGPAGPWSYGETLSFSVGISTPNVIASVEFTVFDFSSYEWVENVTAPTDVFPDGAEVFATDWDVPSCCEPVSTVFVTVLIRFETGATAGALLAIIPPG